MPKHRKSANTSRRRQGIQADLPWGPTENRSLTVRAQYESYVQQSLGPHSERNPNPNVLVSPLEANSSPKVHQMQSIDSRSGQNASRSPTTSPNFIETAFKSKERSQMETLDLEERNIGTSNIVSESTKDPSQQQRLCEQPGEEPQDIFFGKL
ncbi:hypothetical protein BWQ96_07248 [Gracilariopsis chorda]|uniref:Uncharacterized protein n=1 Tax=Gracilariopsis chorda TaxID=448386 RepID=A0A2V3IPE4_9FLOR|nr:hypothetical protein BWQ96_07248 [Gracilariopsis chorda]|eukprot:PXF43000.1 hypothetical protein BWQ96_07248 [Gracilariopsis chorda]